MKLSTPFISASLLALVLPVFVSAPSKASPLNDLYQIQGIQAPIIWLEPKPDARMMEFVPSVSVSAYTSRPQETDDTPCLASRNFDLCDAVSSGRYRDQDTLDKASLAPFLCASNDYPLGTRLWIKGVGECEIRDRMNPRYTGKGFLDIYFGNSKSSLASARDFGRQTLDLWIVSRP